MAQDQVVQISKQRCHWNPNSIPFKMHSLKIAWKNQNVLKIKKIVTEVPVQKFGITLEYGVSCKSLGSLKRFMFLSVSLLLYVKLRFFDKYLRDKYCSIHKGPSTYHVVRNWAILTPLRTVGRIQKKADIAFYSEYMHSSRMVSSGKFHHFLRTFFRQLKIWT